MEGSLLPSQAREVPRARGRMKALPILFPLSRETLATLQGDRGLLQRGQMPRGLGDPGREGLELQRQLSERPERAGWWGVTGLGTCPGPRAGLRSSPVHRDAHHTHRGSPMFCCGSRTVPWEVSRSSLYAQGPVGTAGCCRADFLHGQGLWAVTIILPSGQASSHFLVEEVISLVFICQMGEPESQTIQTSENCVLSG